LTAADLDDSARRSWRLRKLEGMDVATFPWNMFWDQRRVLTTLIRSQIARRHRRSFLGWGWNLIQPGSQAVLLYVATRAAIQLPEATSPLAGFGTFFAAYIIGQGLGEIISRGPTLIAERAAWVKGSLFPLELLAPTAVGVALYRVVPGGLLGVAAVAIGSGVGAGAQTLIAFAVALALAIVWGTTLALGLAAVGVYLRDAILAAPIMTLGAIFVSPLYVADDGSGLLSIALNLNPLTIPMNLVLHGLDWIELNPTRFGIGLVTALVAMAVAARLFRRLSSNFADYI
jgi:lipopolysaccharide transport system permease protein